MQKYCVLIEKNYDLNGVINCFSHIYKINGKYKYYIDKTQQDYILDYSVNINGNKNLINGQNCINFKCFKI